MQILEDKNKFSRNDKDGTTILTGTHPVNIEFHENNNVSPLQEYGMVIEQIESTEIYIMRVSTNKYSITPSNYLWQQTDLMIQYQVTLRLHGLLQRKEEVEVSKDCNR